MFFKNTGMFYIPALCLLALYACWGDSGLSQDKFVPFEGESLYSSPNGNDIELIYQSGEEESVVETKVVAFPKRLSVGDTFYLAIYNKNLSDKRIRYTLSPYFYISPILSSPLTSETYQWKEEVIDTARFELCVQEQILEPGAKDLSRSCSWEFPPLEDYNAPFWKELRKNLPVAGGSCQLRFSLTVTESRDDLSTVESTHDVVLDLWVTPRSEQETQLLEGWLNSTPVGLLPNDVGDRKEPKIQGNVDRKDKISEEILDLRMECLQGSEESKIKIGENRWDPWLFIRTGNRKPSDPNNPTTLKGWRELEAQLSPSVMRDEVRFTRLQLEYYSASSQSKREEARKELVDWLHSLPQAQRVSMVSSLKSKENLFRNTKLQKEYFELINALD